MQGTDQLDAVVAAAQAGDREAFSGLVDRYRRELQVHCYRMLGSFEESEDLTQETFLRAWRKRRGFKGRSTFRAWLYRIATNACLDALAREQRRVSPESEVPWLQPYPDRLLDEIRSTDAEPDAAVVSKETIEIAFLVAIQHLSPKQRVVLILRDVLGWSAKDTASLLDTSVAAVNSSLQRARATLKRRLPVRRADWAPEPEPSPAEQALVQRYIEATERLDTDALLEMLTEDARFSMPPEPGVWVGRDAVVSSWLEGGFGTGEYRDFRLIATRANRQPAVANYLRRPGDSEYRALAVDVLRIEDGAIAEIMAFGPEVFAALGLPPALSIGAWPRTHSAF
jgi:RNA polymerase sigma-70 factor (ECF subfamily)